MGLAGTITYWELRRVIRSKWAAFVVLVLPTAAVGALLLPGKAQVVRPLFPFIATVAVFILSYTRYRLDGLTGFEAGLDSTPAGGVWAITGRVAAGVLLLLVQIAIFSAGSACLP